MLRKMFRTMLRAVFIALLVASVFSGAMSAQRVGGAFRGAGGSGFGGQRGIPSGFGRRNGSSGRGSRDSGAGLLPYYWPFDEAPAEEAAPSEPVPPMVAWHAPEKTPAKPHLIEVPGAADSETARVLPPTIFIFANGERLATRRFLLTASKLSVTVDRQERIFALDKLDLYATVGANRERGIDLRVPDERNVIRVGF